MRERILICVNSPGERVVELLSWLKGFKIYCPKQSLLSSAEQLLIVRKLSYFLQCERKIKKD